MSILLKKKHMREALLFYFNLKKSTAESNACRGLWQQCFIGTTCRDWFRRFNDNNFDLSDKKCENRPRKGCFEDCQLQALLDEDDTQSQKMLAEQLGVFQAAISMRLHAMGKVQKIGKVPHELNDRQMERRQKHMPNSACQTKRKSFLHRIVTGDEKDGSIFRILNARNLELIPPKHQHLPQDQIASDGR